MIVVKTQYVLHDWPPSLLASRLRSLIRLENRKKKPDLAKMTGMINAYFANKDLS